MLIIPVFILTMVVVAGVTADWISPYDPNVGDPNHRLQPGFWAYEPVPPVIVTKEVVAVISPSDIEKQKVQITEYNAKQIDPNAVIGDKLDVVVREGIDTPVYPGHRPPGGGICSPGLSMAREFPW